MYGKVGKAYVASAMRDEQNGSVMSRIQEGAGAAMLQIAGKCPRALHLALLRTLADKAALEAVFVVPACWELRLQHAPKLCHRGRPSLQVT